MIYIYCLQQRCQAHDVKKNPNSNVIHMNHSFIDIIEDIFSLRLSLSPAATDLRQRLIHQSTKLLRQADDHCQQTCRRCSPTREADKAHQKRRRPPALPDSGSTKCQSGLLRGKPSRRKYRGQMRCRRDDEEQNSNIIEKTGGWGSCV